MPAGAPPTDIAARSKVAHSGRLKPRMRDRAARLDAERDQRLAGAADLVGVLAPAWSAARRRRCARSTRRRRALTRLLLDAQRDRVECHRMPPPARHLGPAGPGSSAWRRSARRAARRYRLPPRVALLDAEEPAVGDRRAHHLGAHHVVGLERHAIDGALERGAQLGAANRVLLGCLELLLRR